MFWILWDSVDNLAYCGGEFALVVCFLSVCFLSAEEDSFDLEILLESHLNDISVYGH